MDGGARERLNHAPAGISSRDVCASEKSSSSSVLISAHGYPHQTAALSFDGGGAEQVCRDGSQAQPIVWICWKDCTMISERTRK